ncbi:lantibiotic dehydratase [Pedobacter sp. AW1-32]|uniref:lantibiotic dehydratase n=1 Tax=Pedobacter sp. AW1-32 TaxID=3383026 RepID=UPI003FF08301
MKNDKKDFPYEFHPKLILRTPRYAFKNLNKVNDIHHFLNDEAFLEAIYLASPVLHRECLRLKHNEIKEQKDIIRVTNSLVKYISRMSSRSTPFGLFSGCSITSWSNQPTEVSFDQEHFGRHTRLDMHYLCAMAQDLANRPEIKPWLQYFPNSSIYSITDEIRYVEYKYQNGSRSYRISAVNNSEYIQQIVALSANGKSLLDLASALVNDEISLEDAIFFIDELITAQVLVSELEPAVTGPEFIHQILTILHKISAEHESDALNNIIETVEEIRQRLANLDSEVRNPISAYRELTSLISSLGVAFDESKLFQTDMSKAVSADRVNEAVQESLAEAFALANALYPEVRQSNLTSFAKRFYERYEDQLMPMLDVLDTETGIGYLENSNQNISPLIEGIVLPRRGTSGGQPIPFDKTSRLLFNKLKKVSSDGNFEAVFTEEDFNNFEPNWKNTPPSVSILFKLVNNEDDLVMVETIGGSSGANLLGRFTHADQEIHKVVMDITQREQELNKEVVFAEIIHLPENRIGNIMLHTVFRDYEIPYLGKSSLPAEQQIDASDLMIGVRHNKIILFSKKLGKEIIPRLSTAHNFSYKALPVYQFLCDLQTQDIRAGFKFTWGSMASQYSFLPRMRYKNLILAPAQWQLTKNEFKGLLAAKDDQLQEEIQSFLGKWTMPRYVCLADGDNELLIDFENTQSIRSWLKTIENRSNIILKEFLFGEKSSICTNGGEAVTNQFIATLINKNPVYDLPLSEKFKDDEEGDGIRRFGPGSEWVYFKLYCGPKSADKILEENIAQIVSELKKLDLIDKWFFIRYNDPHFHLRVRFHLTDIENIGTCMNIINQFTAHLQVQGLIWKSQIDSYQREIERYGKNSIELAESLFCADSEALLGFLEETQGDAREDIRWLWGLKSADALLDDFALSLEEKSELLNVIKTGFALEFNMDKNLKLQINKKYADHRPMIAMMMDKTNANTETFMPLFKIIENRSAASATITKQILALKEKRQLKVPLSDLLGAYLHMLLNRLFIADARVHELIVYDIMAKYYQSQIAQIKKKQQLQITGLN